MIARFFANARAASFPVAIAAAWLPFLLSLALVGGSAGHRFEVAVCLEVLALAAAILLPYFVHLIVRGSEIREPEVEDADPTPTAGMATTMPLALRDNTRRDGSGVDPTADGWAS